MRWGSIFLSGWLVFAVRLTGGPTDVPPPSSDSPNAQNPEQAVSTGAVPAPVTAEEVLRTLRKNRPANDIIPSAGILSAGGKVKEVVLVPEGTRMVSIPGRLTRNKNWWTFVFAATEDRQPMKLLPNATLEAVVRSSEGSSLPIEFLLSGEYTVFQGENFLLPRFAERVQGESASPESLPDTSRTPVPSDASAKDVLSVLEQQVPRRQVIAAEIVSAQKEDDESRESRYASIRDGTPLVGRPGRLLREGAWWTFAFESDKKDYPELPIKLLPNASVELMRRATAGGAEGLIFVVSGEVTAFYGENYLLLRSAMRRIEMGNLRK